MVYTKNILSYFIIVLTFLVLGCQPRLATQPSPSIQEEVKRELAQRGIEFSEAAFLKRAEAGDMKAVQLFLKGGMAPDVRDGSRETPLTLAAWEGHNEIIQVLIAAGADVNAATKYGWTSLMSASHFCYMDLMKMFLDAGADVNAKDSSGITALMDAARKGCTEAVDTLLTSGADVSAKDSGGNTALSLSRDSSVRELLKQAGAEE